MAIGSVGVSVVPDAQDFWRRFVEQTRPGAVRAGADLGSDIRRSMQGELDRGVDVRVRADTAGARADIASVGDSANSTRGSFAGLIAVAAALSPALIPIGAVAVPAMAALALGAKDAKEQFAQLAPEFHQLQDTAGKSLAPGVDDLIHSLQQAQPQLKRLVGVFGSAVSDEVSKLSQSLDNGGLQSFINYAEKELPVVESTFNSIVGAVVNLAKVLAPVGDIIVKDIGKAAQLITDVTHLAQQVERVNNQIKNLHVPGAPQGSLGTLETVAKGNFPALLDYTNKGLTQLGNILNAVDPPQGRFITKTEEAAQQLRNEKAALSNATIALDQYLTKQLAAANSRVLARQAEDAFIAATRGVADAVAQGNTSLDRSTVKGLANRDAIISAAQAALKYYDAQVKAAAGTKHAADAQVTAARTLLGDAKALRATAVNAGLSRTEVNKLLASMGLLPKQIETLLTVDASQAYAVLDYLQTQYAKLGQPQGGATTVGSISFNRPPPTPGPISGSGVTKTPGGPALGPTPSIPKTPSQSPQALYGSTLSSFLQSVTGGAKNPITAAFDSLISSLRSSGAKLSAAFVDYLRGENSQLRSVARERDQLAAQLTRAQQHLSNLIQARAQLEQQIRSATRGTFDITTAGQNQYGEPVTLFDIQGGLKQALANAKQFEHVLKRLAREGLNKSLLSQLAEAGPGALDQAEALLAATPRQLAQINSEYSQLTGTGRQLAKFVGNDLYKAGVDSARGLIKGLRSQESALAKTMKHLATVMIQQLRSELIMHSPSRRLFAEGALAFEGYRLGIESKANSIEAAVSGIAGKSIPNRSAYKFDGMRLGSGSAIGELHQHFHNSLPEEPSKSQNAAMRAARNTLGRR